MREGGEMSSNSNSNMEGKRIDSQEYQAGRGKVGSNRNMEGKRRVWQK